MLKRLAPLLLLAIAPSAGCGASATQTPPPPVTVTTAAPPEADENDPLTHVKKLQDPATEARAVDRLAQFFDDAMTRDKANRDGPHVKPLLDKIAGPLSQVCTTGNLDQKAQSKVVKLLADARDPRGAPCLIKTLKDFTPDKTERDVGAAAKALAAMKTKDAAGPLFEAFTTLRHSQPNAAMITRDIHHAVLELIDPSWESPCMTMIGRPIEDRKNISVLRDELYWQITCVEVLGRLKSERAIVPLIKVVLSPVKADAQATAIHALIKIGKPAIAPLVALLQGADTQLVEYAKAEYLKANKDTSGGVAAAVTKEAPKAYVAPAALMLGSIGREDAIQPMLAAVAKADETDKAIMARELLKLPTNDAVLNTVKGIYEKTSITLTIPPGLGARETLLESMTYLFDASLVPWLVKTALETKGDDADLEPMRSAALITVMKLAKADQVVHLDKLASSKITSPDGTQTTLGMGYERELKIAKDLLTECGDKLGCYYAKLEDPQSYVGDKQFIGVKSAYMVGVLGGPEARAKLVELLPKITNAAAKFIAVQAIDRHSPKGDPNIARQLQQIVNEAEASGDNRQIAYVAPFKTVIYRLGARAQ